jgi:hypothetical protein
MKETYRGLQTSLQLHGAGPAGGSQHSSASGVRDDGSGSGSGSGSHAGGSHTMSDADVARLIKERLRKKLKSILRPPPDGDPA